MGYKSILTFLVLSLSLSACLFSDDEDDDGATPSGQGGMVIGGPGTAGGGTTGTTTTGTTTTGTTTTGGSADLCSDTCQYANDGECDDGGPGADYWECALGTDCGDCGPRTDDGSGGTSSPSDCGGVTDVGQCNGTVLAFCDDAGLQTFDCAEYGYSCGLVDDPQYGQYYDCIN